MEPTPQPTECATPVTPALPRFKCHKEVGAVKLKDVATMPDGSGQLVTMGVQVFNVSAEYMRKHEPKAGGYYVRYDDGYESFSPAAAFEAGYTLIPPRITGSDA